MTDGKGDTRDRPRSGSRPVSRKSPASGVEGVRVEVLAKNLGVTKGGFYRRFRDRAALLDAMLQNWSERAHCRDRKADQPRRRHRARTAEGADRALFGAHEYRGHGGSNWRSGNGRGPTSLPPLRSPASMPRA